MVIIDGAAYVSFMFLVVFLPALFLDWVLGIAYRRCRWFRKRLNRFFCTLPQWR